MIGERKITRLAGAYMQSPEIPRNLPEPGSQLPHLAEPEGPNPSAGVGLEAAAVLRALGSLQACAQEIERHIRVSFPRVDDKDFSQIMRSVNGEVKNDAPAGRLALDAAGGANDARSVTLRTREGYTAHVARVRVRATDPSFDLKNLQVTLTIRGVSFSLADLRFARPIVLDLEDELTLAVKNLAAAPATCEYTVEGWLRREE